MDDTLIYALKNMGIYDLRNFARSVGVAKPTTLKRQELISAILDIKTGATEPVVGINRGRKPKNRATANELFYKYSNDYIDYTKTVGQLNSEVATNMPRTQFISKGIKNIKSQLLSKSLIFYLTHFFVSCLLDDSRLRTFLNGLRL